MKSRIQITVAFILILCFQSLYAQKDKASPSLLKQAKKEYAALKYAAAIPLLERSAIGYPTAIEVKEMLANSYRKTKDYKNAMVWYEKLCAEPTIKPEWALGYAEVLANNQQYGKSEEWYKKYLSLASSDKRAQNIVAYYPTMSSFIKNKKRWKIEFTNLNTGASEYSPMLYKSGLVFVSNRHNGSLTKHVYGWDQTPFTDLYAVESLSAIKMVNPDSLIQVAKTDSTLKKLNYKVNDDDTRTTSNDSRVMSDKVALIKDTISLLLKNQDLAKPLAGVNTKYHEGPAAMLPNGDMIFTRNNYYKSKASESSEGVNKLKLFTAKAPNFDDIKPFPFNSNEYSTGHPAINKEGTVLIFASDMPGGSGGADLYQSTRASINDEWSKPVNLGSNINTEGDELFPTFYGDSALFFSSTGHPGLGGLDIFEVAFNTTGITAAPVNLGAPVNSSVDDFSLVRTENGFNGFFTSNRRGNDDIYGFTFTDYRILLKGKMTDKFTNEPIANTQLNLLHNGNRTSFYTDGSGVFEKELPKNAKLNLEVARPGYKLFSQQLSTETIDDDTTITTNIGLEKINQPQIAASPPKDDCTELKALVAQLKIYYDLDKSVIRNDARAIVDKVSALLKTNPQFDLVAASFCDSRASKAYNIDLSKRRSNAAKAYLVARGIDENRIKILYYGEEKPVNKCADGVNCSEAQQQLNRRTDFYIMYKGENILDLDCKDFQLSTN